MVARDSKERDGEGGRARDVETRVRGKDRKRRKDRGKRMGGDGEQRRGCVETEGRREMKE